MLVTATICLGHRAAHFDTDLISEPSRPHPTSSHSFPSDLDNVLRHSAGSRVRHDDDDAILSNDFEQRSFQPPATRKVTKVVSSKTET